MRPEILKVVYPVLNYGLRLKERRDEGKEPDLDPEQAVLKGLLNADAGRRLPEYYGDERAEPGEEAFLGIRYALTCWLDEILIDQTPWGEAWNNKKLEWALFRTNKRADEFPLQARKAEARQGVDALEAYFLCVMLGFRGHWLDNPQELQNWFTANQARIAQHQQAQWQPPPALPEPPTFVPPLRGWERFQKMRLVASIMGLAALLALVVFVIFRG